MPWTRYYDPKAASLGALMTWTGAIFELVLTKTEFWMYIAWNLLATTLCIHFIEEGDIQEFEWDAATVMQYVMTFFVTFYNDRCFERYNSLYPSCQDFMDAVVFFVQEMNVSLYHQGLVKHRIVCTKYLLATVYEYFMIVCGGKLSPKSWEQLVKKGLLTEEESETLQCYPGGQATFVLTSWVLFIIRDALVHDCLWVEDGRHQQTVHIYNRHCNKIVHMLKAAHRIGYMMGLPIPFAYYHLMNLILVFNVALLATVPAMFRSYWTVFPFFVALLIYMGLREVSTALSDPFNQDSVDFPIPSFLSQTFDRTVCLLLAFEQPDVRARVLQQVEECEDFSTLQLTRAVKKSVFNEVKKGLPKGIGIECRWGIKSVFEDESDLTEKHSKKNVIRGSLFEHEEELPSEPEETTDHIDDEKIEEERKLKEAKERQEALKEEVNELEVYLDKLRKLNSHFFEEQEDALYDKQHQHDHPDEDSTEV